ncbi:NAD-dependent epimerase/dehydratase family protein [Stygiobacter electus]|uniref:NAD-dependent epimerase/dehydratase family protein n=1 Tax=Stygiobacter electus TaxID=3032292 RepID=A0AAE3P183_9BACT|nr:NAD-dependent epimerase/dehydratase family protein [Stygiobacter electus]MDF1612522.1 NAD-dependent epimerase/dehydratase family protein [Stygiobacter electus]
MKTKVVVTGGAGFIGSHIVEYWIHQNAEVHIIDNLRSGYIENVKLFPEAIFHLGSVTNRNLVFEVLKDATYVHHLAALVSVPESVLKPDECFEINVKGTKNILDAAKEFGIKKVVLSSSAAVYGDNPESPKRISMKPEPKTPYASTKLDGEKLLKEYNDKYNLGTVSLRYFNVFGPRQDPKSQYAAAIPIFISKALNNEKIIIYGDGEQTRDFIFVKDVVKANILAATNENANGVYNIARGEATTINQIAKLIISELKSKSEIEYQEERLGDIKHSLASIEESIKELNFQPKFDLVTGLNETIKYFKGIFNNRFA